jgi:hypothetical protein
MPTRTNGQETEGSKGSKEGHADMSRDRGSKSHHCLSPFSPFRPLLSLRPSVQIPLHQLATFALVLACVVGCGSSGPGRLMPVKGKVTLDDKALTTGSLVFKPDATKGNNSRFEPSGTVATDGSYSLFTKEKEGAPPGWYKVGIVAEEANAADPYAPRRSLVPNRYNDAETSGLSIEVASSPPAGAYDLKLAR